MVKIQSLPANRGKERSKVRASGVSGTSWVCPTLYRAAGTVSYEQSYVILGGLLLAGGIIGLLFIRPEADRARLAAHTVMLPVAVPARA